MTPGSAARGQKGFALLLVLLVLLALTALFHGSLVLARSRVTAARASAGHLRLRLAAEGAARLVSRRPAPDGTSARVSPGRPLPEPGPAGVQVSPRAATTVEVRHLSSEWLWLEATASTPSHDPGPRARIGRVLWVLDPVTRIRSLTASGSAARAAPAESPIGPAASGLHRIPPLGLLDGPELRRRAGAVLEDARIVGTVRPGATGCPPAPEASSLPPPSSGHGGADATPGLRVREGSLALSKVSWTGVLAVSGDLAVAADARFDGLVLVGGGLELRPGACLRGLVRAAAGVRVEPGGELVSSAEVVERVLTRVPRLAEPLPAGPSSWIALD